MLRFQATHVRASTWRSFVGAYRESCVDAAFPRARKAGLPAPWTGSGIKDADLVGGAFAGGRDQALDLVLGEAGQEPGFARDR
jgi:hypothetical protein